MSSPIPSASFTVVSEGDQQASNPMFRSPTSPSSFQRPPTSNQSFQQLQTTTQYTPNPMVTPIPDEATAKKASGTLFGVSIVKCFLWIFHLGLAALIVFYFLIFSYTVNILPIAAGLGLVADSMAIDLSRKGKAKGFVAGVKPTYLSHVVNLNIATMFFLIAYAIGQGVELALYASRCHLVTLYSCHTSMGSQAVVVVFAVGQLVLCVVQHLQSRHLLKLYLKKDDSEDRLCVACCACC